MIAVSPITRSGDGTANDLAFFGRPSTFCLATSARRSSVSIWSAWTQELNSASSLAKIFQELQVVVVVSLKDSQPFAAENSDVSTHPSPTCALLFPRTESTRFLDLSMNIFVALIRSSTGRTCACNRAWWRASFNLVTVGSSLPTR